MVCLGIVLLARDDDWLGSDDDRSATSIGISVWSSDMPGGIRRAARTGQREDGDYSSTEQSHGMASIVSEGSVDLPIISGITDGLHRMHYRGQGWQQDGEPSGDFLREEGDDAGEIKATKNSEDCGNRREGR